MVNYFNLIYTTTRYFTHSNYYLVNIYNLYKHIITETNINILLIFENDIRMHSIWLINLI